jgi:ion channel POLLUX/CASTOR
VRAYDEFKFWLERQLVRGAGYRLFVIAALVGLISVIGGAMALGVGSGFGDLGGAVWWAFLRLTDPGYLGDDVGTVNRVVSTTLTVLGYVVFLGALVAVMTQWLDGTIGRLEQGLTPVARNDHIIILGWTNRTEAVVRELLLSRSRVRRMLKRRSRRGELHIVVLARQVTAVLAQDLRDALADAWDERRVTLRSGSALQVEHLERVDAAHASAVIIPGREFGAEAGGADTATIKALLSLNRFESEDGRRPYVVAEVFRAHNVSLARQAYVGELEVIASDAVVSRLMARNVLGTGLSVVYNQLLTHGHGQEIYIREVPADAVGGPIEAAQARFPRAILLGAVCRGDAGPVPRLNPAPDFRLSADDRLVLLAPGEEEAEAAARPVFDPPARGRAVEGVHAEGAHAERVHAGRVHAGRVHAERSTGAARRVLILGWNHKLPALLAEFQSYRGQSFDVHIVSTLAIETRLQILRHAELRPDRIRVTHAEADRTNEADVAGTRPEDYDTILLLASDRTASHEESDARTLLAFLLLEGLLEQSGAGQSGAGQSGAPDRSVIVELLDPENVALLGRDRGEVIVSPLIVSHMLAQVALRRELRVVLEDLFAAGGTELVFYPITDYTAGDPDVTFAGISAQAAALGEVAVGVRTGLGVDDLHLNPDPDSRWPVAPGVEVAALVTQA